jgi:hypothetical protein
MKLEDKCKSKFWEFFGHDFLILYDWLGKVVSFGRITFFAFLGISGFFELVY